VVATSGSLKLIFCPLFGVEYGIEKMRLSKLVFDVKNIEYTKGNIKLPLVAPKKGFKVPQIAP